MSRAFPLVGVRPDWPSTPDGQDQMDAPEWAHLLLDAQGEAALTFHLQAILSDERILQVVRGRARTIASLCDALLGGEEEA